MDQPGPEYAALKPRLQVLLSRAADRDDRPHFETLPKFDADLRISQTLLPVATSPGTRSGPTACCGSSDSGGMGSVWLAERRDGLIKRPVALKLPHQAWHRAGLAERMAREREILAALTHPNIARLYDAGVTAERPPWLALEYVEGQPIDEYCRIAGSISRRALRLFLQMANAVRTRTRN